MPVERSDSSNRAVRASPDKNAEQQLTIDVTEDISRAWESGEIHRAWVEYAKPWDDMIERWILMIERTCSPTERAALLSDDGWPLIAVTEEVRLRLRDRWQRA